MANIFDQFDEQQAPKQGGNIFDQFDIEQKPVAKDFAGRMQEDFERRKLQSRAMSDRALGMEQSTPETLAQMAGIGLGVMGDVTGNAIGSAYRYLPEVGATEVVKSGLRGLGEGINAVAPNAKTGLNYLMGEGARLAEENPRAAANLGAAGNILSVAPIGAGVKGAARIATNPELQQAALRGAGNTINLATKPIQPLINKTADYLLRQQAVNAGQIIPEKLPKELQRVYARLRADFPDDAEFRKVLNSYASTKDKALIQAGGARTSNLAEGAAQYPSGGARATEFFNEATGKAPEKLKTTLGKTVSPSTKYYDDLDTMVEAGQAKAAPLYKAAFKNNQVVESPVINNILNTPSGKRALAKAAESAANKMSRVAKPDPELTALARELGVASEGGVSRGLKLSSLDQVKKSMDRQIGDALRGQTPSDANEIIALKNTLVDELDAADKSGFYKQARSVSGDYLSNKKAMDAGLSFLTDDSEIVARTYKGLQGAEKAAYKNGVVKSIRKQIENTQDGANVARIFNKPATRDKLKSILKPQEYDRLLKEAKSTDELFKLRNQLTGNSRTAARQIAAEEFDSQGAQIVDELVRKGATRTAIDRTVGWVARRFDGLSDKSAKQVADVLYETDPRKKYEIVKFLTNQANMEGSSLRKLQAQRQLEAIYGIEDKVKMQRNYLQESEGLPDDQLKEFIKQNVQGDAAQQPNLLQRFIKDERGEVPISSMPKTETPEFKNWFGDSKVVDAEGKPLKVFHGTGRNYGNRGEELGGDFSSFDPSLSGKSSKTGAPEGSFFFTDSPEVASGYTVKWQGDFSKTYKDGANVMPTHLSLKKPLVVNAKGENWNDILYKGEYTDVNDIARQAKESGKYDGVIIKRVKDHGVGGGADKPSTTYIVFKPEQIKSIHNSGAYDPNNPNILGSVKSNPALIGGAAGAGSLYLQQKYNK